MGGMWRKNPNACDGAVFFSETDSREKCSDCHKIAMMIILGLSQAD